MELEGELDPNVKFKMIRQIEKQTKRRVAIETEETSKALSKCHPQDQSPLFASLPRELRDLIWEYATAPYEDDQNKYNENEYFYRPGHTARLKTHWQPLLTCRLIWLEANQFPMLQAEHCFWYHREAPDGRNKTWMGQLTQLNRQNFGHLHLFAQMYTIEGLSSREGRLRKYFLHSPPKEGDFQPRIFHTTIRHTDWWNWEHEAPLRFKDSWLQAMLDTPDLRSTHILRLELETLDYKVNQLLPIVDRLEKLQSKEYETHVVNGQAATTKFVLQSGCEVHNWSGPANIDGQSFFPYAGKDKLNYHFITLTWRLHFPQFPNAHVPKLRRAARVGLQTPPTLTTNLNDLVDTDEFTLDPIVFTPHPRGPKGRLPKRSMEAFLHFNRKVWMSAAHKSDVYERLREAMFAWQMGGMKAKRWREKWDSEGSLLHLEE